MGFQTRVLKQKLTSGNVATNVNSLPDLTHFEHFCGNYSLALTTGFTGKHVSVN